MKIFEILEDNKKEKLEELKNVLWFRVFILWLREIKKENCKNPEIVFFE